jgi:DNA (cytosine-5)-methyltransferase 1
VWSIESVELAHREDPAAHSIIIEMVDSMERHDLRYISLFSGGGGLDLGLEMAGWKNAYASDNDPFAVETLKANTGHSIGKGKRAFEDSFIECADVRSLTAKSILSKAGLSRGDAPLLAGGPPCQSWSSAGRQLGFDDPRGRLLEEFVRLANELDTRWLLMENVRGLLTARGPDGIPGSALDHVRRDLLNAGFQTTVSLLNAADFGVPQRRVRLLVIGYRSGDPPPFPQPTHSKVNGSSGLLSWLPLSSALTSVGKLAPIEIIRPSGKMAIDLESIAPGSGVKSQGKAERTRPGGHWGYKQGAFVTDPTQSARTVTASAQQDWIRDKVHGLRRLCPRECAAIQSFPPSWEFKGSMQVQYRLIGNAVPPRLAQAIGQAILPHIRNTNDREGHVTSFKEPLPLPPRLAYHVSYTKREEASNGQSRREAPQRRTSRTANSRSANGGA